MRAVVKYPPVWLYCINKPTWRIYVGCAIAANEAALAEVQGETNSHSPLLSLITRCHCFLVITEVGIKPSVIAISSDKEVCAISSG
jgi:hypothetical protein